MHTFWYVMKYNLLTMQKLQFAEVQVLAPKCGGTPDAAAHGFAVMHNNMLIDDWDRKKMDTMHL